MSAATKHPAPLKPAPAPIRGDTLESGDRMDADEFMRLYERSPHIKKAELVQGVVYVASPVSAYVHGKPDALLQTWLGVYQAAHAGTEHFINTTLRLSEDTVCQPDGMLGTLKGPGEPLILDDDGYLRGAPELVCEVAASSKKLDLHFKKDSYLQAGVREYLVWRTLDERIDWFFLDANAYSLLSPDAQGVVRSRVFPGLALDVPAALRGDSAAVLATLQRAIAAAQSAP